MSTVTEALRSEHQGLLPRIEAIRQAAEEMDEAPLAQMKELIQRTLVFVCDELLPHARTEDAEIYPVINHLFGEAPLTAGMAMEHEQITRFASQLGSLHRLLMGPITSPRELKVLRRSAARLLYSLYALIGSHFTKEEEVYLPLLDRLSPAEAESLLDRMGHAVADTRARAA